MSLVRKTTDSTVRANLTQTGGTFQPQAHSTFEREPLLKEIPDQGMVLATVSGTAYVYFRIGINRYRIAGTLVP